MQTKMQLLQTLASTQAFKKSTLELSIDSVSSRTNEACVPVVPWCTKKLCQKILAIMIHKVFHRGGYSVRISRWQYLVKLS
jgi:hypothetical protein